MLSILIPILTSLLLGSIPAAAASSNIQCSDHKTVIKSIMEKSEFSFGGGTSSEGVTYELFVHRGLKSWTIIAYGKGPTCVMKFGTDWKFPAQNKSPASVPVDPDG